MEQAKAVFPKIKAEMAEMLRARVTTALEEATVILRNQSRTSQDGQKLFEAKAAVVDSFLQHFGGNFDRLLGDVEPVSVNVLDYGSLSLVEEGDLEAIIAMEGMVAHARNCDISEYLAFTTRIDSLFFGTRIDESNNPMDPEQIGDAFKEALRPLNLHSAAALIVYRQFNSKVFHELEAILSRANELLIEEGVMADLDMAARTRQEMQNRRAAPRERSDPTERAFQSGNARGAESVPSSQQMFAMIQSLMRAPMAAAGMSGVATQGAAAPVVPAGTVPAEAHLMPNLQAGMMIGGQKVELVAGDKLLALLGKLDGSATAGSSGRPAVNLSESLGKLLVEESQGETFQAVDGHASDVINLITLLYEAIWDDETVPIPIKELIGRTQITLLKIALADAEFFERDSHPARVFINELATAGISWTDYEKLEQDPMYRKMHELVEKMIDDYSGDTAYIEALVESFQEYKKDYSQQDRETEKRLQNKDDREERLDEVKRYARQKITERILDENTPAVVREFLENQFHRFLVEVILREGPGGNSWKPIMNTIDVLLWTVQRDKSETDRNRFKKVNGRLLINLGKSMEVAGIDKTEADAVLKRIQKAQKASFEAVAPEPEPQSSDDSFEAWMQAATREASKYETDLSDDDEHLQEVESYPLGIWMEFAIDGEHTIRCTLAARIASIDKYIFVNDQGVKVIEKSKMGLARELKAGTVKVISASPLVDRAMEAVIGRLRSNQAAESGAAEA